ncbi:IcmE/DotG protein [Durusdinium trenchii]|uniref:IcmE/DotG protein n=1 Tax=Durusdinium trenchii TaxID=1381693 RepID=A0ABP0RHX0_9DINO
MRAIIALRESRSSLGKLTSVDCLVAIKEAGYTAKELYRAGFTFSEFLLAECSAKQMKEAGFTAHNMRTAGFSMQQLQDAGFTAKQLKDAGFTGKEMRDAGFSLKRLKQAGRAHNERVMPCGVYTGTVSCGKLLKPAVERNWFTAKRMIVAGVSLERLKKAGFTARELTCAGFSCQELQESRFSGKQLKEAGFAATKMIVGSSLGELRDAGFTVRQLKEAGLSCAQLRNAGFAKAAERGFSLMEINFGGFSLGELKHDGFSAVELMEAGFSAAQLKEAGYTPTEPEMAGFTYDEMKDAQFADTALSWDSQRVAELIEGGCTLEDLTRLGFRPAALKAQNSILELKCAGFSAAELKELRTAGYSDSGYEGVSFFLARDQGGLLSTPTTSISGSPGACQLAQQREQNPGTYTISDGTPCDAWKLIQTTWPNCETICKPHASADFRQRELELVSTDQLTPAICALEIADIHVAPRTLFRRGL